MNNRHLIAGNCLHYSIFVVQTARATILSWDFSNTPYLWNVNLDGNTCTSGNEAPVDTYHSIFTRDNLDTALWLAFEANNGHDGILLDGLRARCSDSASIMALDTGLAVANAHNTNRLEHRCVY